jgi:hypothetical protein
VRHALAALIRTGAPAIGGITHASRVPPSPRIAGEPAQAAPRAEAGA